MTDLIEKTKEKLTVVLAPERKEDSKLLEILFLLAMICFLMHFHMRFFAWTRDSRDVGSVGAMILLDASFLIGLVYVSFSVVSRTLKPLPLVLTVVCDVFLLHFWPGLDYGLRCWIVNAILMFGAFGRPYDRILKVFLIVVAVTVVISLVGLRSGFLKDNYKTQGYGVGHSLGYAHTNNFSRLLLWSAMLIWLLWLRRKDIPTLVLFGAVAVISATYLVCRTTVVMAVLMPLTAAAVHGRAKRGKPRSRLLDGFLVASPWLFLLLSVALSFAIVPLIPYFRHHILWNMASRFVQNNIALREYGITLTGRSIDFLGSVSREFYGEEIRLLIVDNAYVPWMIRYGILRTVPMMCLLSLTMWKAVRLDDRPLVTAFFFILFYGLMEPAAVQVHYNISFLFLLAADRFTGMGYEGPVLTRRRAPAPGTGPEKADGSEEDAGHEENAGPETGTGPREDACPEEGGARP